MPNKKSKTEEATETEDFSELQAKIDVVQQKIEDINNEAADEIVKINQKYALKKAPHFKERNVLFKQIPGFWKQVFSNHPILGISLSEQDDELLTHLEDLELEEHENSFKFTFKFKPNPYLKKNTLWKQYTFPASEDEPGKIDCSVIEFKEGKELANAFFTAFFKKAAEDEDINEDEQILDAMKEDIYFKAFECYQGLLSAPDDGDELIPVEEGEEGAEGEGEGEEDDQ